MIPARHEVLLDPFGEELHMLQVPRRVLRVFRQPRRLSDMANRTVRPCPEGDRALCGRVVVECEADSECLEQRVLRSLHADGTTMISVSTTIDASPSAWPHA